MRKLLAGRFVWDVEFPSEFEENFLPFFAQKGNDLSESLIVQTATELFKSACCLNLGDFHWSDLTLVSLPSSFKHLVLDAYEVKAFFECYKTL